ncbi:MAG TPA: hypothetical protein VFB61_01385, partial [Gemmatimonadales bacterium]|nr:hypothetical protein [Gemmatimonadales bacterium]
EVWKVEGLEAGRPGEPGFQRSLSLQGADVQLIVYNKGKIVVEATVTHTFPRPIPRLRCTLDVDGAQEAAISTSWSDREPTVTVYYFNFRLPQDPKKLDLTLALPRVRVVDFTARPSRVTMESP